MQSGSLDVADSGSRREWTLMVVNDDRTVNAAATFGESPAKSVVGDGC